MLRSLGPAVRGLLLACLAGFALGIWQPAAMEVFALWPIGSAQATVGASGGLFGLLLGFAMMFPKRRIMLLIPPIPMPAWLFVLLFGALELYLGVSGTAPGIAHFAHLGGMLGGFWMLQRWRVNAPRD